MLGTNPEKASNIMACRKMVNYFMAAVIPIYSLHFAKYNFPIEIQTRYHLRDYCQQRTLRMSASCYTHLRSLDPVFA